MKLRLQPSVFLELSNYTYDRKLRKGGHYRAVDCGMRGTAVDRRFSLQHAQPMTRKTIFQAEFL